MCRILPRDRKSSTAPNTYPIFLVPTHYFLPKFSLGLLIVILGSCTGSLVAEEMDRSHPVWTSSRITGTPDPPPPLRAERIFHDLTFKQPIAVETLPACGSCSARYLLLQRHGQLLTFDPAVADPVAKLALDIQELADRDGEKIAAARDVTLSPDFESDHFIYVAWSIRPHLVEQGTRISRFKIQFSSDAASDSAPFIDPESRFDILTYPSGDHVGISLNFGPDGCLYITTGDGSLPFPPDALHTAQDLSDVRGSVLRIDVRPESNGPPTKTLSSPETPNPPYRIPPDNPFVNVPDARGEIYAFGLRNGFRAAFDPADGQLWVADVGWEKCEMVHRIVKGGNHGWSLYEGPHPINLNQIAGPGTRITPAVAMDRAEAQSITGGFFVSPETRWPVDQSAQQRLPQSNSPEQATLRDDDIKGLPSAGDYLFGCFVNGGVWSAHKNQDETVQVSKVASTGLRLIEFFPLDLPEHGQPDAAPGIGVVDFGGGGLYRLATSPRFTQSMTPFPIMLSETGLFRDLLSMEPSEGVVAFDPAGTMFRDGLVGSRVLGIPADTPINPAKKQYAKGTVFANTLSREILDANARVITRKIETQILHYNGLIWAPYTYAWNETETEAFLVPSEGKTVELRVLDPNFGPIQQPHRFASRAECLSCHHSHNRGSMSLRPENLWHEETLAAKASSVPIEPSQRGFRSWGSLVEAGYVTAAKENRVNRLVDHRDDSYDLSTRARSYLHFNCSACHRRGGGATSTFDLQRRIPDLEMAVIDSRPTQGDFGIGNEHARIISPGHPELSTLIYRVATGGPGSMPRLGCANVDIEGARLLWDWVASMESVVPSTRTVESSLNKTFGPTAALMQHWHETTRLPPDHAVALASQVLKQNPDPITAGLFQPWTEPNQRVQVVGLSPDVEGILNLAGDPDQGRLWFTESSGSQCRQCHRLSGVGIEVGPPLVGLKSKRSTRQLLRQLTHPSDEIDPKWQTVTLVSFDGEVLTGIIREENESEVTLQQADGKQVTWPVEEIELRQTNPRSMMPEGTLATMTPQEVADLLAFLLE